MTDEAERLFAAAAAAHQQGRGAEAAARYRQVLALRPEYGDAAYNLAMLAHGDGDGAAAEAWFVRVAGLAPADPMPLRWLVAIHQGRLRLDQAAAAMARELALSPPEPQPARRSVVIPVLDYSPGSPFNIRTLLDDLAGFDGEVICVFNGEEVWRDLAGHPRIDKYCHNRHNVGVARAWNMGINQAEGRAVFILNADLHVTPDCLAQLEDQLFALPGAVLVGVAGDDLDPATFQPVASHPPGSVTAPLRVDRVSGWLFAVHAQRFHDAGLCFDPRLSPYYHEETDIAAKAAAAGLSCWVVPASGFEHHLGISASDRPIHYFGRLVNRNHMLVRNGILLRDKLAARYAGVLRRR